MFVVAKEDSTLTRRASEGKVRFPRWRVGLVMGLVLLATASPALAQRPLRWKLKAGDELQVNVSQQTIAEAPIFIPDKPAKMVKTTMDMTLETLWTVDSADEQKAKITQTVKRIALKMKVGDAAPVAYDSADKAPPIGAAKNVAAAVKPLLAEGSALIITMNLRGEVLTAEPSAKLAELWKMSATKVPGGPDGKESTAELKRSMVLLPETPVSADDATKVKWSSEREVEIPIGKVKQSTEFVYAGEVDEGGRKLDKIDFTSKLDLVPGGAKSLKLTIKTQEQTGHALFSAELGRVVSAEQTQKLVTEAPYRETNITVTVDSTVKTQVRPIKRY